MPLTRSFAAVAMAAVLVQTGHGFQLQPAFRSMSTTSGFSTLLYSKTSKFDVHDHNRKHFNNRNTNQKARTETRDSVTIFSQMDADGNDKVSLGELKQYLLHFSDGPYTEPVVDSIFSRLDTNQDGSLSLKEFQQALQQHELFRSAPGIELEEQQQQQPSNNKKKQHHPSERQQQRQPTKKTSGGNAAGDHLLKSTRNHSSAPNNKKGPSASLKKLYQEARSYFHNIDTDKDGSISSAELKEYFVLKKMTQIARKNGLMFAGSSAASTTGSRTEQQQQVVPQREFVLSETAIDNIFRLLDINADGRISFWELRDAFVRYRAVRQAFRA